MSRSPVAFEESALGTDCTDPAHVRAQPLSSPHHPLQKPRSLEALAAPVLGAQLVWPPDSPSRLCPQPSAGCPIMEQSDRKEVYLLECGVGRRAGEGAETSRRAGPPAAQSFCPRLSSVVRRLSCPFLPGPVFSFLIANICSGARLPTGVAAWESGVDTGLAHER